MRYLFPARALLADGAGDGGFVFSQEFRQGQHSADDHVGRRDVECRGRVHHLSVRSVSGLRRDEAGDGGAGRCNGGGGGRSVFCHWSRGGRVQPSRRRDHLHGVRRGGRHADGFVLGPRCRGTQPQGVEAVVRADWRGWDGGLHRRRLCGVAGQPQRAGGRDLAWPCDRPDAGRARRVGQDEPVWPGRRQVGGHADQGDGCVSLVRRDAAEPAGGADADARGALDDGDLPDRHSFQVSSGQGSRGELEPVFRSVLHLQQHRSTGAATVHRAHHFDQGRRDHGDHGAAGTAGDLVGLRSNVRGGKGRVRRQVHLPGDFFHHRVRWAADAVSRGEKTVARPDEKRDRWLRPPGDDRSVESGDHGDAGILASGLGAFEHDGHGAWLRVGGHRLAELPPVSDLAGGDARLARNRFRRRVHRDDGLAIRFATPRVLGQGERS